MMALWQEQRQIIAAMMQRQLPDAGSAALEPAVDSDEQQVLLAEQAGNLRGFLWLRLEHEGSARVVATAVDLHGQGAAVGRALWSAGKAWLTEHEIKQVMIPHLDATADAFWLAQGARDVGSELKLQL